MTEHISTIHDFTPKEAALINRVVIAANTSQERAAADAKTVDAVFAGIMLGRGIDIDAIKCRIVPENVAQFETQVPASAAPESEKDAQ